jgi:hypothetical protein
MTTTTVEDFFTALGSSNEEVALGLVTADATFEAQGPPTTKPTALRAEIPERLRARGGVRRDSDRSPTSRRSLK